MKITPILDRVLIKPIKKEQETKSGIILNASSHEKPEIGTVVAIGSGDTQDGEKVEIKLNINDNVLFNKFAGTEVSLEGTEYIILKYCDILAVINN